MRLRVVRGPRGGEPPDGEPDPGLELGGPAGVQDDVVHAPVVGDHGQPALGDHEQHRRVGARRTDQAAQVAGVGEVLAAVDEQQVDVGRLEQGAALGGQDLDLVPQQGEAGEHLDGRLQRAGEQQKGAHGGLPVAGQGTGTRRWASVVSLIGENTGTWSAPPRLRVPEMTGTPAVIVHVHYWASAKAAAGVAGDELAVDGRDSRSPRSYAGPGAATPARDCPTCWRPARCWSVTGRSVRATPRRSRSRRDRPWSSCRRSPAADPGGRLAPEVVCTGRGGPLPNSGDPSRSGCDGAAGASRLFPSRQADVGSDRRGERSGGPTGAWSAVAVCGGRTRRGGASGPRGTCTGTPGRRRAPADSLRQTSSTGRLAGDDEGPLPRWERPFGSCRVEAAGSDGRIGAAGLRPRSRSGRSRCRSRSRSCAAWPARRPARPGAARRPRSRPRSGRGRGCRRARAGG